MCPTEQSTTGETPRARTRAKVVISCSTFSNVDHCYLAEMCVHLLWGPLLDHGLWLILCCTDTPDTLTCLILYLCWYYNACLDVRVLKNRPQLCQRCLILGHCFQNKPIVHTPDIFAQFSCLCLRAPSTLTEVASAVDMLDAKMVSCVTMDV